MDYDNNLTREVSYASDTFFVRFFWKEPSTAQYLQLTVSRIAYTQLMSDMDRGISGAFYKILESNKNVHRLNKYSIRNVEAWKTPS